MLAPSKVTVEVPAVKVAKAPFVQSPATRIALVPAVKVPSFTQFPLKVNA